MKPDKEQEIAIKCIHNHSLIIAGAGTGKTTTLLLKINYLIKNNVNEKNILVISFTNETVNHFREKCPYNITVTTFHKLAKNIINAEKDLIEEDILKELIEKYLYEIPIKLKKTIYYIFNKSIYTSNKYKKLINNNHNYSLIDYFFSLIKQVKTNQIDIKKYFSNKFNKSEKIILYITQNLLDIYSNTLKENNCMDFDDLIIDATNILKTKKYSGNYKYILVDEYQDISLIRQNFLKNLVEINHAVLTAVGDDFQSIYGFSGSNIDLFYNFKNCFINSQEFYIATTYRCPQAIVNKAGKFIMKNPNQIKKELISVNQKTSNINKIYTTNYSSCVIKIIKKYLNKDLSILILGRNNFDVDLINSSKVKFEDSYLIVNNIKYKNIRFLTIHKSKGLEADIVIIINLSNKNNGIPSKKNNKLIDKLINKKEEIKFAEERRLFYVALTRTKNKLYLIIDKYNPSVFVKEI